MNEKKTRGRPPKFDGSRRPITTTLPETTLQQLQAIDTDRAVAIVKAAAAATVSPKDRPVVEAMDVFADHAVIVVGPSKRLRAIGWVHLVEITPSRFLIAVPTGTPIEALELEVSDILEHLPPEENYERKLLTDLRDILSHRRRSQAVRKVEILLLRV